MVAIGTFEWTSLKVFGKVPVPDLIVMVLVTGVTVVASQFGARSIGRRDCFLLGLFLGKFKKDPCKEAYR